MIKNRPYEQLGHRIAEAETELAAAKKGLAECEQLGYANRSYAGGTITWREWLEGSVVRLERHLTELKYIKRKQDVLDRWYLRKLDRRPRVVREPQVLSPMLIDETVHNHQIIE